MTGVTLAEHCVVEFDGKSSPGPSSPEETSGPIADEKGPWRENTLLLRLPGRTPGIGHSVVGGGGLELLVVQVLVLLDGLSLGFDIDVDIDADRGEKESSFIATEFYRYEILIYFTYRGRIAIFSTP
mmetsp:Transcript_9400/g.11803  ORF Transcript_9400/g.11803 Transcript_9400/m.11803 type:complete len:127 (-) Transcript_9400:49-429(-)